MKRKQVKRVIKALTIVFILVFSLAMFSMVASAGQPPQQPSGGGGGGGEVEAKSMFLEVVGEVLFWIGIGGGVIIIVGGIILGSGQMSNDATQKTTGVNVMIAGAIVAAVCFAGHGWITSWLG